MTAAQVNYGSGPSSTLLAGMIPRWDGRGPQIISLLNNSKAAQIETLQCTSTSYAVTLKKGTSSRSFSATGLAGANACATHLHDAIEADGIASGWVSASVLTDTVTCTARFAGTDEDVTYSGTTNVTAVEATAASDGAAIGFGLAVMHDSTDGQCLRPTKTTAVAQVDWATPTAVNSLTYTLGVQLNDVDTYLADYVADGTAIVQEIVEGIVAHLNAVLPASTVLAAEDNTKVTLTAEVAGTPFTTVVGTSTTAVWAIVHTTPNTTPGFTRPLAGFAVRSDHIGAAVNYSGGDGTGASEYDAGTDVAVMEAGALAVETDDTVSRFDPVYVRITATGTEKVGSVRNDSDSGDCILLSGARFLDAAVGTSAAHATVRIQFDLSTLT